MTLQLADRSVRCPEGILIDTPVKIGEFWIPVDFVVIDIKEDSKIPIISGRSFLATCNSKIDVGKWEITMAMGDEQVTFNINNLTNILIDQVQAHEVELSKLLSKNLDEGPEPETHTDKPKFYTTLKNEIPELHADEVSGLHMSKGLEHEESKA